MKTEDKQVT